MFGFFKSSTDSKTTPDSKLPVVEEQTKPKPCCACPETKKARDSCFFDHGDEAEKKCHYLILAHRDCMKSYGYEV
ncbi:hypothetical protein BB558_001647 [Smittium angustum]|uniref:Cytochrome c oxidase copper chaperone n=1 Tax=Smittium angustum TaxID=133377 RepID=A0A2U1IWJ9_SMIAN|nr:hypothetical protein BB558_006863 [Smittium angustum]PWA02220.1 hypothetical protein BB558_001647 [Smittium angustum]